MPKPVLLNGCKFFSGYTPQSDTLGSGGQSPNQAGPVYQPLQQPHGEHKPTFAPSQPLQQGIATMSRSEDLVHISPRPILVPQPVLESNL